MHKNLYPIHGYGTNKNKKVALLNLIQKCCSDVDRYWIHVVKKRAQYRTLEDANINTVRQQFFFKLRTSK